MSKVIRSLALFVIATASLSFAQTYVNGYTRSDGTYVPGHYRSEANNTTIDNYSTSGNTNPYTGSRGTHNYNYNNDYNSSSSNSYNSGSSVQSTMEYVPGYTRSDGTYVNGYYRRR